MTRLDYGLIGLGLVLGCGSRVRPVPAEVGRPCEVDSDCAPDFVCVQSASGATRTPDTRFTCQIPCQSSADCADDYTWCTYCSQTADPPFCQMVGCS